MSISIDTSALAKIVVDEPESAALRAHLRNEARAGRRFSISTIAVAELRRLAIRLDIDPRLADDTLARFDVVRLDEGILQLASRLPHRMLGTLDAIHLATALTIGAPRLITYDLRQADAARAEGLAVDSPA